MSWFSFTRSPNSSAPAGNMVYPPAGPNSSAINLYTKSASSSTDTVHLSKDNPVAKRKALTDLRGQMAQTRYGDPNLKKLEEQKYKIEEAEFPRYCQFAD